jgi:hypothetical protein
MAIKAAPDPLTAQSLACISVWASNGAPIKVIYPSDGTVVMESVAIIKGGSNIESAEEDAMTRTVAAQIVETLASGERIYGIAGNC